MVDFESFQQRTSSNGRSLVYRRNIIVKYCGFTCRVQTSRQGEREQRGFGICVAKLYNMSHNQIADRLLASCNIFLSTFMMCKILAIALHAHRLPVLLSKKFIIVCLPSIAFVFHSTRPNICTQHTTSLTRASLEGRTTLAYQNTVNFQPPPFPLAKTNKMALAAYTPPQSPIKLL